MRRCSISLVIREIQIKTTMSYHLHTVYEEASYSAGGNVKWYSHFGKQSDNSSSDYT